MVASIIKRAGGRVEVASEVGQGTTFTIVLPAIEPAPAVRHTVLLVDDDPLVRQASQRMLERGGYGVLEAADGAAALAEAIGR